MSGLQTGAETDQSCRTRSRKSLQWLSENNFANIFSGVDIFFVNKPWGKTM